MMMSMFVSVHEYLLKLWDVKPLIFKYFGFQFLKPQETIQWWNQQTLFALPLRLIFVFLRKSKDLFFHGGRVAQCVAKSL